MNEIPLILDPEDEAVIREFFAAFIRCEICRNPVEQKESEVIHEVRICHACLRGCAKGGRA